MKEQYLPAEMDIVAFSTGDVILTSDVPDWTVQPDHPCPNEGPTSEAWV
jgi:hypothetical protein